MADVHAKYQKLAQEYSKLKAQAQVLKKAVIDEQNKNADKERLIAERDKAGVELQEAVREKEKTVRKCMQEMDSLGFRNQQLFKRVSVLQEEMDTLQKSKKGKSNVKSDIVTEVHTQELQAKISENERLHQEVDSISRDKNATINELERRLNVLETQSQTHSSSVEDLNRQHRMALDRLQQEKTRLESRTHSQETELKSAVKRADASESELKVMKQELSAQIETMSKVIADKLSFNDSLKARLNVLNVPPYDRQHQAKSEELITQAGRLIKDYVAALSNVLSYTEQRSRIFVSEVTGGAHIGPVNEVFCKNLHEHARYLRPLNTSYAAFKDSVRSDVPITWDVINGLAEFVAAHHRYACYMSKLLPYQLLSIEEECRQSVCTSVLEKRNMALHTSFNRMTIVISKVNSHLQSVTLAGCSRGIARSNLPVAFSLFCDCLVQLHNVFRDISTQYSAKMTQEHQLPTVGQKLKTTDECMLSSLTSVVSATGKISQFVSKNLEFFTGATSFGTNSSMVNEPHSTSRAVASFRQQAREYMEKIARPPPLSISYELALRSSQDAVSSSESRESLAQQISQSRERIAKLEQDKEYWMLEAQLTKIKYEKEQKKSIALEEEISRLKDELSLGGAPVPVQLSSRQTNQKMMLQPVVANRLASPRLGGVEETSESVESEQDTRETLIKNHFSNRISELTMQLQHSDAKAVNYEAECRALHKHLHLSERAKDKLAAELELSQERIQKLEDELTTTSHSYDAQLSMMSDHLCGLNDKLTSQQDEIDVLKMKGGKKKK
ncbi:protein phosphatase 1 regulatory subunit 21-like [Corticium candelabrum]|uniref:protein phosphatase 1 regulatory subunit 21-like n=1 Tax=Corticium candelabrum TaxID=121492 RepID=UPI002E2713FB|nr:protein phosphatase 1 regulatory subunit 21-like [Corticium candelabrum]